MVLEPIICLRCGLADNYRIEVKAHNHVAYCNDCGGYIKNIPYSEPTFYFGRYKGMKVSELIGKEDLPYLEWFLANIDKLSPSMKDALTEQINFINKNG